MAMAPASVTATPATDFADAGGSALYYAESHDFYCAAAAMCALPLALNAVMLVRCPQVRAHISRVGLRALKSHTVLYITATWVHCLAFALCLLELAGGCTIGNDVAATVVFACFVEGMVMVNFWALQWRSATLRMLLKQRFEISRPESPLLAVAFFAPRHVPALAVLCSLAPGYKVACGIVFFAAMSLLTTFDALGTIFCLLRIKATVDGVLQQMVSSDGASSASQTRRAHMRVLSAELRSSSMRHAIGFVFAPIFVLVLLFPDAVLAVAGCIVPFFLAIASLGTTHFLVRFRRHVDNVAAPSQLQAPQS